MIAAGAGQAGDAGAAWGGLALADWQCSGLENLAACGLTALGGLWSLCRNWADAAIASVTNGMRLSAAVDVR